MKNSNSRYKPHLTLRVVFLTICLVLLLVPLSYPTITKFFVAPSKPMPKFTYTGFSGTRDYYVYTPKDYSIVSKVPLVVLIHGCTQTSASIAADSKFNDLADKEHFIIVYPEQSVSANALMCWNWAHPADQLRGWGEPAMVAGIVETVQNSTLMWNIDKERTYVVGLSTGAALTVILGVTYPDLFAAIGVGSGFQYQSALSLAHSVTQNTLPGPDPVNQGQVAYQAMGPYARRVPTLVFHGAVDKIVPPIHGREVVISMTIANSLADPSFNNTDFFRPSSIVNGQAPGPLGYKYTTMSWNDIHGKPVIQYYRINSMDHAWSGGSPPLIGGADIYTDPHGPSFTEIVYQFFMANPMNTSAAAVVGAEGAEDPKIQLVFDY